VAVRLDSGDFAALSRQVRQILDEAGLDYVKIVVSGGLDEYELYRLVRGGAPIDIFGVGTKVGVSADAPWSDMAYKLVCYDGRAVMKLSTDKVSLPGAKQVFRLRDREGGFYRDVIGVHDEGLPGGEALLQPAMADGRRTGPEPTLEEIRHRFQQDFQRLDDHHKQLHNPPHYPVAISPRLERLTIQVQEQILAADPAAPFPSPSTGEGQDGGELSPRGRPGSTSSSSPDSWPRRYWKKPQEAIMAPLSVHRIGGGSITGRGEQRTISRRNQALAVTPPPRTRPRA
jgi:hypothetical protein